MKMDIDTGRQKKYDIENHMLWRRWEESRGGGHVRLQATPQWALEDCGASGRKISSQHWGTDSWLELLTMN